MSMSFEKLRHAFSPISITLQIFGLQPFYIDKNETVRFSSWKTCITVIYFLIMSFLIYISKLGIMETSDRFNGSLVLQVIIIFYRPGLIVLMVVTFILRFRMIKKDMFLINQIFDIINILKELSTSQILKSNANYMFWYNLKLVLIVVFGNIISNILFVLHSYGIQYGFIQVIIASLPYTFCEVIIVISQVVIVAWLLLIQKYYEIINVTLIKLIMNDRIDLDAVQILLEVHEKLRKCVCYLNGLYSFQLLLVLILNYFLLLAHLYFILIYMVTTVTVDYKYSAFIFFLKMSIQCIFNFSFITSYVVAMLNQVSNYLNSINCNNTPLMILFTKRS